MNKSFIDMWGVVFDSFKDDYPTISEDIVDWYPSGYQEITVKDRDGNKRVYNWILHDLRLVRQSYTDTYPYSLVDNDNEDEWRIEFSLRLRRKIMTLGMSQDTLSAKTGISQVTLSKYLNGKSTPSSYNIKKIAKSLGCSVDELISI